MIESAAPYAGLAALAVATLAAWSDRSRATAGGRETSIAVASTAFAAVAFALAIAARWTRVGHGPFLSLHEILLSNAFSLSAAFALAALWDPRVRVGARIALPVLVVVGAWLVSVPADDTVLPPTYSTPVLWLHVAASKLFLGLCLVAVALACASALGARGGVAYDAAPAAPGAEPATETELAAWQYFAAALAAETLLLVAGAWWAQDAWGRYWDWDPLETWAFVTWAAAAAALHLRVSRRWPAARSAWLIVPVFLLAFWTFFGVPFVSTAPHKGAI